MDTPPLEEPERRPRRGIRGGVSVCRNCEAYQGWVFSSADPGIFEAWHAVLVGLTVPPTPLSVNRLNLLLLNKKKVQTQAVEKNRHGLRDRLSMPRFQQFRASSASESSWSIYTTESSWSLTTKSFKSGYSTKESSGSIDCSCSGCSSKSFQAVRGSAASALNSSSSSTSFCSSRRPRGLGC